MKIQPTMYIEILSYIQNKNERLSDLKEIFFLNAKVSTDTEDKRNSLFAKYAKPYIENWPDDVFFACDLNTKKTIGYLLGCRNSLTAVEIISPQLGSYNIFSDLFKKFPAHLHINILPEYHGRGVGTFLIQEYLLDLKKARVAGVHVVTAPDERNVGFYLNNKFTFRLEREYSDHKLLFMGRSL